MELGIERIAEWMRSNRLRLNPEKTDFLWCATRRRCMHLDTSELSVCGALIRPSTTVRDLGVLLGSDPAFQLTPKRTFLPPRNLSNTSRIFGLGVSKIPNIGCIRPFVFSRTYMTAQQALRLIKYYFVCMKFSRPVEAGCLGSQLILTYFHSYRRARERIS